MLKVSLERIFSYANSKLVLVKNRTFIRLDNVSIKFQKVQVRLKQNNTVQKMFKDLFLVRRMTKSVKNNLKDDVFPIKLFKYTQKRFHALKLPTTVSTLNFH